MANISKLFPSVIMRNKDIRTGKERQMAFVIEYKNHCDAIRNHVRIRNERRIASSASFSPLCFLFCLFLIWSTHSACTPNNGFVHNCTYSRGWKFVYLVLKYTPFYSVLAGSVSLSQEKGVVICAHFSLLTQTPLPPSFLTLPFNITNYFTAMRQTVKQPFYLTLNERK